ncbi:hypothetical protein F5884DRAFT_782034 [Xylogone sp. PMI_703]|nr:hypothetical protein F5884DRAFT_782034 [Xylogone sp. PMI_703]
MPASLPPNGLCSSPSFTSVMYVGTFVQRPGTLMTAAVAFSGRVVQRIVQESSTRVAQSCFRDAVTLLCVLYPISCIAKSIFFNILLTAQGNEHL